MIAAVLNVSAFNSFYAGRLLEDVPDAAMAEPAGSIVNHPAWQVGHVLCVYDMAARMLGAEAEPALAWAEAFGSGSRPVPERGAYPPKREMLAALERGRVRLVERLKVAPADVLGRVFPIERLRAAIPTVGDGAAFALTAHAATHWGQLSAWRRARGMGSVM